MVSQREIRAERVQFCGAFSARILYIRPLGLFVARCLIWHVLSFAINGQRHFRDLFPPSNCFGNLKDGRFMKTKLPELQNQAVNLP